MNVLGDRLKNPHFANWMGNTLALEITNCVLRPYVNQEIMKTHSQIVSKFPPGTTCKSCNWKRATNCSKNICNKVKKDIEDSHRFPKPSFKNTNASMWLDDHWEIAKCFMPPNQRNKDCTSAEADFSAVVNIIINDKHFDALVSCDLGQNGNIFDKAREMRNNLMHKNAYKVGDTDFQNNLNLLINLLNDFVTQLPKKQEAIEELNRLKTVKLQIEQQHIDDTIGQFVRARQQESDRGEDEIKRDVQKEIVKIKGCSQQRILKAKFVEGCKYSLLKLVEGLIASLKPPNVVEEKWTLSRFLDKIEYIPGIAKLPDPYRHLLYPDLGKAQDVSNWDLFLLCYVLSVQISKDQLPNSLENYIKELKDKREDILDNPADVKIESLGELTEYLDEPLRSEVTAIFMSSSEYSNEDPLQVQNTLDTWRHYDGVMDNRPVTGIDLQNARRMRKFQKMERRMKRIEEKLGIDPLTDSEDEGLNDSIGTEMEIVPTNCSRIERENLQNNITGNGKENIATAQGGLNHFKKQLKVDSVQPIKGSIILKVTCRSVDNLILFWESCMNGKALRALSKIRDDYRQYLGCNTLDFDIVLKKKEVNRCMDQIVERLSSKLLDERLSKVEEKAASLETETVMPSISAVKEDVKRGEEKGVVGMIVTEIPEGTEREEYSSPDTKKQSLDVHMQEEELFPEMSQKRMAEDKPIMSSIGAVKEDVKRGEEKVVMRMKSLIGPDIPEKTEREEYISEDTKKLSLDVHTQGPSGQGTLKKGTKYTEYDATRLVKFLEEIAENFEEGKISVIKPYLEQLIKHSKDRDKEAFDEVIMDFTEATKFRSGISVTLLKQTFRGFRMILTEPDFGDLVAEKVEGIEKREELMGGVESKAWQIDPKISAEDIPVGDKIAKEPSKTSDKPDQRAGTSKGFEYHKTEKDVSSESKLSPIQVFKKDVGSSKVESFKMKSTELAMEEDKPKSMESMSFKRKPGSPGSVEATETSPAPKS